MTHAIKRTSRKGLPFVGQCIKCGEEGLPMKAAQQPCPADAIMSDEQALIEILETPDAE